MGLPSLFGGLGPPRYSHFYDNWFTCSEKAFIDLVSVVVWSKYTVGVCVSGTSK